VQEDDEGHWPAGKRMYIKEMILENFKSYAGTQRIGPFHKVEQQDVLCVQLSACHENERSCVFRNAEYVCHHWAQRMRQVEHHRRAALHLRQAGKEVEAKQNFGAHSQFVRGSSPSASASDGELRRDGLGTVEAELIIPFKGSREQNFVPYAMCARRMGRTYPIPTSALAG